MQSERLSLVEVSNVAGPLSSNEVAAIVAALCRASLTGHGVGPTTATVSPHEVWLEPTGNVHLTSGVIPTVAGLGALLEELLAEIRRAGPARFPPGLVMTAARATGRVDWAPFASREALAQSLARFEPPDAAAALKALFEKAALESHPAQEQVHATEERPVVVIPNAYADVDYEYQRPVVAPATAARVRFVPDPVIQRRRWRGRFVAAAVAATAAGAVAGTLFGPSQSMRRATESTEVVLPSSTGTTPPKSSSKPRSVSPRAARPLGDQVGTSAPTRSARAANSKAAPAGASPGKLGPPQPLVGPTQADSTKVFSPSFDQNGSAVFFHAETATGSALKRADPGEDGVLHVVTIVDDAAKNYHVQLSPDGKSVAFDSDRDGVRGVYVARADGRETRRVSGEGYAAVPTWSPDGRRLAFLRAESDRPNVWNLWMLDLAKSEMTRLTNYRYGQVWGGAWFPDGQRIAYSHEDRLMLLELGTGRTTVYDSPLKKRLVRTPAVSPDGRLIIFQVYRDGAWLLHLDSGSMERVLDDSTAEEFTWAPNGNRVAFHSRRRGEWGLWVMAAR
jgi:hypothetical protein